MLSKIKAITTVCLQFVLKKSVLRTALAVCAIVALMLSFSNLEDFIVVDGGNTYYVTAYADDATDVLGMVGVNIENDDTVETASKGDTTFITIDRMSFQQEIDSMSVHFTNIAGGTVDNLSDAFNNVNAEPKDKVEFVYKTVKSTVKFKYKTVYSDELDRGQTKTTKGKNGQKETVYITKFVNGEEVETKVHSETVTVEPVDQVQTIGTKYELKNPQAVMTSDDVKSISELVPDKPVELDAKGNPVSYSKIITGKATAYCKGTTCATGVKAKPGYVAVDPKEIPYGTKLYIVSADGKYVYGYAIAADTGGFAKNPKSSIVTDLRFNTYNECIKFGKRNVVIYVLK